MTIDTPRGTFVIGRIHLPAPGPVQIERALAMAAWAAAFYARRAADAASRRGASAAGGPP